MGKKRISLTLDEDLVEKIDAEAESLDINRSQTVEKIAEEYFKGKGLNTAVILCGDPENKTLNLYEGKPVLGHILENLSGQGVSRVILLAGQNRDEIREQFGDGYDSMTLEYIEDQSEGTAAALSKAEKKVNETFVALNGHVVADVDLEDMLRVHREEDSSATMALTTVSSPSNYGVARLKGRKILGFEEKPERGEEPSQLINAGTYILDEDIFQHLNAESLEKAFENLADEGLLSGYIYGGKWKDIDR
ncbi:ribbon-helix-helix protein, CopG family [Candidatus Nanohaloarchaea archaeon]|nr:ribbon-helix-helix protein, CopG family [Candidatus Nanohaloarchaea archaeon]